MEEGWEEFNPTRGLSFVSHMVAGSTAGMMEHITMFPVDTIKTHMQIQRSGPAPTARQVWQQLTEVKGFARTFRGIQAMFTGCIPAHAVYFSVYEASKEALGTNAPGHHPLASASVGAISVMLHDAIMTPMDFCKQRLQLGYYSGLLNCMKSVWAKEGLRAFFVSYPTTLLMNVPFHGVVVATNESLKLLLKPTDNKRLEVLSFLASGAIAGALAAAVTNPLDVIKTRLQTQTLHLSCSSLGTAQQTEPLAAEVASAAVVEKSTTTSSALRPAMESVASKRPSGIFANSTSAGMVFQKKKLWSHTDVPNRLYSYTRAITAAASTHHTTTATGAKASHFTEYSGIVDAARHIWREEGFRGFTRGIRPRIVVNAPSTAICWTTYEVMKNILLPPDWHLRPSHSPHHQHHGD